MEMVEKSGENIVVVVQHGEGRRGNRDYLKNYRRYLLVWISSFSPDIIFMSGTKLVIILLTVS